ncbi:MAG TPA: family 43 glycosylhydrolase, partial [Bacillota bacterium]|nr:family 43 glycosylhydrolase [Bacillota bacterium]
MKLYLKKSLIYIALMSILIVFTAVSFAINPLITTIYTADADCLVANNAFYVYCGRDEAASGQQAFIMDEWHILKSTDMRNWTDLGVKLSLSTFKWANANAWAGSVCYKNGKYWWYVPVNDKTTNAMAIGVASSTSPEGPFTDALGHALITNQTPNCNIFNIDPGVFVDDNGQAYLYWGGYWALRAVKLNDDMISFSGTPIQPSGVPYSGTTGYWEAPTLRKYNGLYYFSYAANQNPATIEYCTATNPMGPWTYRGRILDTTTPTGTNHHSYAQYGGRWFIVYHTSPAGDDYHRRVHCDEMFYNADGTIRKVVQTSAGPSPVTGIPTPTSSSIP